MTDPNENPYAPPQGADEPWMPAGPPPEEPPTHRSGAPKVFGVLSIVFASLVLLFGLMQSCTGLVTRSMANIGQLAPDDDEKAVQVRKSMSHMATIYSGMGIQGLILALMSGLLLAIGVGQLRYRRWAQQWTVYWSWAAFVAIAAMVAISFLMIGPAYQRFFDAMASSSPTGGMPAGLGSSMSSIFGGTTGVLTVIFYAPYPILLLIFFSRERIRAVMNQ